MAQSFADFLSMLDEFPGFSEWGKTHNCRCDSTPLNSKRREAAAQRRAATVEKNKPGLLVFKQCSDCGGFVHHRGFHLVEGVCLACREKNGTRGDGGSDVNVSAVQPGSIIIARPGDVLKAAGGRSFRATKFTRPTKAKPLSRTRRPRGE